MSNPNAAHAPVTVIGLGLMGQALAAAFVKSGHPTTVWNRTAAKADELVGQGATLAGSVADAVTASPLVIVCVSDYDAVTELLDPLADELAGRVLVNLTTGTSTQAREAAEWAAKKNTAAYFDGAIMAIPPAIGTDEAVLLYSGPKDAFDEHEATLKALSDANTKYLDSDHGVSSLYDMSLLGIMWGILNSFLNGAALVGTAGVKATAYAPLANFMINVVTGYVTAYAEQIDKGEYPAEDATLHVHIAAIDHLLHESKALGINAELPQFYKSFVDRAVEAGHVENSYSSLIEVFRKP